MTQKQIFKNNNNTNKIKSHYYGLRCSLSLPLATLPVASLDLPPITFLFFHHFLLKTFSKNAKIFSNISPHFPLVAKF